MLNINSPTVQAMLNSTPQGFGNIPVYYGNTPTVDTNVTEFKPIQPVQQQKFPSPMEMLMQNGQNSIYGYGVGMPSIPPYQTAAYNQYQPQVNVYNQPMQPMNPIVGGYNPGYNAAFSGYTNPYMGYQQPSLYNNFGFGFGVPMDELALATLETATNNGLTYEEQVNLEADVYKRISRIVSKNLGRTEEQARMCEEMFTPKHRFPQPETNVIFGERLPIGKFKVCIKVGDLVIATGNTVAETTHVVNEEYYQRNMQHLEFKMANDAFILNGRIRLMNYIYDNAIERRFDRFDNLIDFFNNNAGFVMADMMMRDMYSSNVDLVKRTYDSNEFRRRLLENNSVKTRKELKAAERFVGRYGIMPDGTPTAPGVDPAVAESFSFDPKTGMYHVTCPEFLNTRKEQSRELFIKSLEKPRS